MNDRIKHALSHNFPMGFVLIAEGLAQIISLGLWCPPWSFHFCGWHLSREMRRKIKRENLSTQP